MSFFENENVKKGWKNKKRFLLISIGLIVIAILCYFWGAYRANIIKKEALDLENVISSKSVGSKEDKRVKLKIYYEPSKVSEKVGSDEAFYIVSDNDYYYMAKMYESDAMRITNSITENGYELVGYTSEIPEEVKKFAIDAYNESFEDELDHPLTIADFESVFGDVCIDLVKDDMTVFSLQYGLFAFGMILGGSLTISALIVIIIYKKRVKKISDEDLRILGEEVNSAEAVFYDRGNVYLTRNYLIDVNNLLYYKYEDLFWVYKHIQRVNGIISYTGLMVSTNDAKQTMMFLNAKGNYERIIEQLLAKNGNLLVGFTKENKEAFKELKKKVKEEKRNKA